MKKYSRIALDERENIYKYLQTGNNQTQIADLLGRYKSSISKELKRCNGDALGYLPDRASAHARKSLCRRNRGVFRRHKLLASYVLDRLKAGWSPEQIAGRLKVEIQDPLMRVSHETIYKFVYGAEGQSQKLYSLLGRRKPKRTRWHSRKPRQSHIPELANIKHRAASVQKRKSVGHWEGDLVVFGSLKGANVTTIVERKSRFVELVYNPSKYTTEVVGGIKKALQKIPEHLLKSITFDRGTEFASFRDLNIQTYFCNPHSPWQKGSNENFNGRLRRYLPKKYNSRNLSQVLLDEIAMIMNNQPRKGLDFKTPFEVLCNTRTHSVALDY